MCLIHARSCYENEGKATDIENIFKKHKKENIFKGHMWLKIPSYIYTKLKSQKKSKKSNKKTEMT